MDGFGMKQGSHRRKIEERMNENKTSERDNKYAMYTEQARDLYAQVRWFLCMGVFV